MPYRMTVAESEVFGLEKYKNAKGNTECVEFVRQVTGAPPTGTWKKGKRVKGAQPGEVEIYTAIATFDDAGRYPTDAKGRHAAIYLAHDGSGISVLDQWNSQKQVLKRTIRFGRDSAASNYRRSNDGDVFYVIEG